MWAKQLRAQLREFLAHVQQLGWQTGSGRPCLCMVMHRTEHALAAGAAAGAVAVLATATVIMAVGCNQVQHEQEFVRYPLTAHAHGAAPRGALLQPDQRRSAPPYHQAT